MFTERRYIKASSRIAQRHKIRRYAGLFLKMILPVAVIIGLVLLLRADFLQIKDFEVAGAEGLKSESIKDAAFDFATGTRLFFIPKSNIFLLDKAKLAAVLLSKFGRLEKVNINKQFFSESIKLSLTERKADFLWCSSKDDCYFMTKDGLVFEKISVSQLSQADNKIIFEGVLEENPLMKNFAAPEEMQNYLRLVEIFKSSGFDITSISIESKDKGVAKSSIGEIIFSPEEDLSKTAQNAVLLINEVKGKNASSRFQYIDARFGNKIFYKLLTK